ncbi:MAG: AAA family ATPase [Xanthobacteraceae bacterium]|nr:AAA family ATPase [Xanthobacteraceae bacterium]MBV9632438.1 AAA family ATPase [Xanthobacteraceae bacterium]
MRFDQPPRPSPSLVPSPERVAAGMAEIRARAEKEVAAAFGRTAKPAAIPQLVSGTANTFSAPEWVWPERIARGKLTVLGGAPGSGKSAFVTDVIARVTAGSAWPCQEGMAPQGAVLLIAPQGDADVFGLRFRAAGGELTQLHTLREVKDGAKTRPFDFEKDVAGLNPLIEGIKDLRLIAIDALPVPGGRGAAAARKTEALFEQLAALACRHNVAVLAIARQSGGDYLSRKPVPFGSLPLTAATTAFLVEIDPNDEGRRLLLQVKNELSGDPGTLAFGIVRRENAAAIALAPAKPIVTPRAFTARNAPGFNSAKADAIAFLRGLFAHTPQIKVREIEQEARAVGLLGANQPLSQCRPLRDARAALDLIVIRAGFGPGGSWVWAKPDAAEADQSEATSVTSPPIQPAPAQTQDADGWSERRHV